MKRIYLVEDESVLLDSIKMNLSYEGYEVIGYQSGHLAFEKATELASSDLVILDVMLPGVNGIEVCKEIRKHSEVPILFLSAKGMTSDRVIGLKAGANDYLPKPFDLEELLLKVKILLAIPSKKTIHHVLNIGNKSIDFNTFEVLDAQGKSLHVFSKEKLIYCISLLKTLEEYCHEMRF